MNSELKSVVRQDLYRYGGRTWEHFWRTLLSEPGFRYTYYLRCCHFYRKRPGVWNRLRVMYSLFWLHRLRYRYGFQISTKAQIAPGLAIAHLGHVVIHTEAKLGQDVNLSPGCVIGQTNRGKKRGVPQIGNRVWIGSNAIIVGKIVIGDDAMIGPGAYVNFDVPERAVVIGNPGQIVSWNGSEGYIENLGYNALDSRST